jgi:ParB-like chromosome segregation protein Spo0J
LSLFEGISKDLVERARVLFRELERLPLEDQVTAINEIRRALHQYSPFKNEPVDCVIWVPADQVAANGYNPNTVAPPEMRLLEISIIEDGYTQPVVAFPDKKEDREYTVIDGDHRSRVGRESKRVRKRVMGYLPITIPGEERTTDIKDRMASTIRHNRARGVHGVIPMVDIVSNLIREGWTDAEIAKELGMDADEVLRFKQTAGLPELFKNRDYSRSWV